MPAVTIYLSRLIGVGALVVGIVLVADKALVVAAVERFGPDRSLLVAGSLRIAIGALIVLTHNIWLRGFWSLVITLTGWTMLMRGVVNLLVPTGFMLGLFASVGFDEFYYLYATVPLSLGAYLTLRGFSATVAAARPPTDPA